MIVESGKLTKKVSGIFCPHCMRFLPDAGKCGCAGELRVVKKDPNWWTCVICKNAFHRVRRGKDKLRIPQICGSLRCQSEYGKGMANADLRTKAKGEQ